MDGPFIRGLSPIFPIFRDSNVAAICCDNRNAARRVADFFVTRGFESVAYIAGTENTSTNSERESGFTERLAEHGLSAPQRALGGYSYQGGYDAALQLGEKQDYLQAVFCANDIMAMGAMDAIRFRLGLRIPEDVSVVDLNQKTSP
ncbi:MAG: substrate-binding domain-containing protein [Halieaceae bacterium]|nr:substrate-binding domain-containing protein [Halieaceae bacterium]